MEYSERSWLQREADAELCRRSGRGAVLLPLVLLAVFTTTTIPQRSPKVSAVAFTVLTVLCLARIYDVTRYPTYNEEQKRRWKARFVICYLGCCAVYSLLAGYVAYALYGREWEPLFFVIILCGMASGGVTILTPEPRIMKLALYVLLLPVGIAFLATAFYGPGVTVILFLLYAKSQGKSYSRTYWEGLRARKRLVEKSDDLETALSELTQAADRFQSAFETAPIGVAIIREDGRLIQVNEQLAKTLGAEGDSLLGRQLQLFFEPATSVRLLDCLHNGTELECSLLRPDGTRAWVIFKAGTQPQREEGLTCYIGQFVDITQRKHTEAALHKTRKAQSLGVLAAGLAHELNTPLQFMGDNLRFLNEGLDEVSEGYQRYCEVRGTHQNSDHAFFELLPELDDPTLLTDAKEAIAESLEGLARVTKIVASIRGLTHGQQAEARPIDINATLLNALSVSESSWKTHVNLETDLPDGLPRVVGDEHEMGQVFLNLILNAAHAIEEASSEQESEVGLLSIATRLDSGFVEILVSDTGLGVDEDIQAKIFDPFFTTKEVGCGVGQGLTYSQSVVERHGGVICFETRLGQGTTFIVRLPAVKAVCGPSAPLITLGTQSPAIA